MRSYSITFWSNKRGIAIVCQQKYKIHRNLRKKLRFDFIFWDPFLRHENACLTKKPEIWTEKMYIVAEIDSTYTTEGSIFMIMCERIFAEGHRWRRDQGYKYVCSGWVDQIVGESSPRPQLIPTGLPIYPSKEPTMLKSCVRVNFILSV